MGAFIEPFDLEPFASIDAVKASAMIEDAEAMMLTVAPCLAPAPPDELTDQQRLAVRAVLRGAILRWNETGSGAMQSQTAGPFSVQVDTRQQRRGMFFPSEIEQLRAICGAAAPSGAFTVDTVGLDSIHQPWCALAGFSALYCSCGADIAGYPLWEYGSDPWVP